MKHALPVVILAALLGACAPAPSLDSAIDANVPSENATGMWAGTATAEGFALIQSISFNMNLSQAENGDISGLLTVKGINSEPILVTGNAASRKLVGQNSNTRVELAGNFGKTSYTGRFDLTYNVISAHGTVSMVRR